MLETLDIQPGSAAPRGSIIWLHGLGADMNDFAPIVPELGLPESAGLRFVFPNAPPRPITLNGGMVMRAWFDIADIDRGSDEDEAGIRESDGFIRELIEREKGLGLPAERIVLAGFSQGGAMTFQTGLRYPERLAGLLVLSSWLPLRESFEAESREENRGTPIFQAHGEYDPLVPFAFGKETSEYLRGLGHEVDFRGYPCQHGLCLEEVADIGAWLRARLSD